MNATNAMNTMDAIDAIDRSIVRACQAGLPLLPRPFHHIAEQLGIDAEVVMQRLTAMQTAGMVRRIGVVPNHYALGYRANGMTVWNVDDAQIERLGQAVGQLSFVSHCYQRPRALPEWPYNLFAMVHAKTREEVEQKAALIAQLLGEFVQEKSILYSKRILKKTGMRL